MGTIGITLLLAVFFAIGIALFIYGLRNYESARAAKSWPTVEGKILSCNLETHARHDGSTYKTAIKYGYDVEGQHYEGDRIAFGYSGSNDYKEHQQIFDRLSKAKTVLVRYNPLEIKTSVLSYGINSSNFFIFIFSVSWLLIVSGVAISCVMSALGSFSVLSTLEAH